MRCFRNLVFLLAHTLGSVHLLAFDKLRDVVLDLLPKVIKKLWEKERKGDLPAGHFVIFWVAQCPNERLIETRALVRVVSRTFLVYCEVN